MFVVLYEPVLWGRGCDFGGSILSTGAEPALNEALLSPPRWARTVGLLAAGEPRVVGLENSDQSCFVEASSGADASLVTLVLPRANSLRANDLRIAVSGMLTRAMQLLHATEQPHLARMWSLVPGIHDTIGRNLDRYRVFNLGRFDAFCRWFGGAKSLAGSLPAATCVGHQGNDLVIHALGMRSRGEPVENPRQVPAIEYSNVYGPRPPCFARAMLVHPRESRRLLVSGTSSVRGEESVYAGSLAPQFDVTIENIDLLAQSVRGEHRFDRSGVETARVYCARAADLPWLMEHVSAVLPRRASIEYLVADICRPELLVEIEVTIAPLQP